MSFLHVIKPGLLTTIQDRGRWGFQDRGVPVGGPMDPWSHRLANAIVGNDENAATLEITLIGPELEFEGEALVAVTGATFRVLVDGGALPLNTPCRVARGSRIRFAERSAGARAYLAIGGGVLVAPVMGSRATHALSEMGGLTGRALAAGDRLPIPAAPPTSKGPRREHPALVSLPRGGAALRVMLGPQDDRFTQAGIATLQSARFMITPQSDRMAYRLDGPALERIGPAEIISDATPLGSIQVPASGQPILLMADRATTGGYPKIATVVTADLGVAGQLAPGDWVEFAACTSRDAVAALLGLERSVLREGAA